MRFECLQHLLVFLGSMEKIMIQAVGLESLFLVWIEQIYACFNNMELYIYIFVLLQ